MKSPRAQIGPRLKAQGVGPEAQGLVLRAGGSNSERRVQSTLLHICTLRTQCLFDFTSIGLDLFSTQCLPNPISSGPNRCQLKFISDPISFRHSVFWI